MREKPMGYRIRTVNLYRTAPKYVRLKLIPRKRQLIVRTLIKCSSSLFVALEREISRCKQSSWMRSNVSTMVKTYFCGSHGSLFATRLCRLFSTTSTVTVELAVVVAYFLSCQPFCLWWLIRLVALGPWSQRSYNRSQRRCNWQEVVGYREGLTAGYVAWIRG